MAIGSFCLVLHGHLPYVLRHGTWPHGEDWLNEAAAETYIRIISMVKECVFLKGNPHLTVGLTPILLEQLSHDDFKKNFMVYLDDRIKRARSDRADFKKEGDLHAVYLAERWEKFYKELADEFEEMDRNIPRAFAELHSQGHVEILTSCATHGYLPLLLEDSAITAQIRAGIATSERVLGFRPKGIWLPECAYRPPGHWHPPISWGEGRQRRGIEHFLAAEGITHFFVENWLIEESRSEWVDNNGWKKVDWEEAAKYPDRGWRSVQEPVNVASSGVEPGSVVAFARDAHICEQVWSGSVGYPADGLYLEFHKKQGEKRGLRYWKVTDSKAGLGDKDPYRPDDIPGKIHEHASHFCSQIKGQLQDFHRRTGRHGAAVACFDAELFGHWWFEGPLFLRDVLLALNSEPDIALSTPEGFLEYNPPDKAVALPEGSWGDGGDHRVWVNEKVSWMWEVEYRCEMLFGKLTYNLPWEERQDLREILEKAGRELLLLQASDWPFVIARDQAVDYGIKRFMQHVTRFECLIDVAEKLHEDPDYLNKLSEVEKFDLADVEIHDVVFPKIDLTWWNA